MVESFVGTDITMADEIGEDANHLDKGADLTLEDQASKSMNGGTGTTWISSLLGKKLWRREKHKGKISPSSSRMMRTISIHHLECNDFVSQSEVGEKTSDIDSSKNVLMFDSLAMSESESQVIKETHESAKENSGEACRNIYGAVDFPEKIENHLLDRHIVLKGKLIGVRDALLKLKDVKLKGMANEFANWSKLFLDTLELFNSNREAILDAPEDLNNISPQYVERSQVPAKARMLTKSASFPVSEFSGSAAGILLPSYKRMKSVSVVTQGKKFESVSSFINNVGVGSGSHELRKRREAETVLNRLRNLKERIKDVILENRKEKKRISRDSILHKVPFGHELLQVMRHKKLNGSASERCDRGSEGGNFDNAPGGFYSKFAQKSFRCSCSLNESLDRYSQLLETFSLNEKGAVPESSKSIQKDNGLLQGKLPKSLGRMLSSPVLRSYSFAKVVQSEVSLESSKFLVAEPLGTKMNRIVRSNSPQEDNSLQQEKLPKNFGRMLSSPVFRSYSFSNAVESEHYLEASQILTPQSLGIEMEKNVDKPITDAIISPILEKNHCEHEMVVYPDSLFIAEEEKRSDKFLTPTVETITKMIESQVSKVSMDDSEYIEASLFTEVLEEEADLSKRHEAESAESDMKTENPSFISSLDLNMVEGSANSAKYLLREGSELQSIKSDEQNSTEHPKTGYDDDEEMASYFLINVENKYDTLFEFVRHILSESRHEIVTEENTDFEQNLLYDLINEASLKIYEHSTVPNPWLLHFHSKIRSMPVGNYLLKDVWTEIRWHLCATQDLDATLDDLMAHDFAIDDGWMNLYRVAESVAMQLEYLILDDLLDEAVVDSDKFVF